MPAHESSVRALKRTCSRAKRDGGDHRRREKTYRNIIPSTSSIPAAKNITQPVSKPLHRTYSSSHTKLRHPPIGRRERKEKKERKNILKPPRMHPPKNLLHIFPLKTSPLLHFPTSTTLQHRRASARYPGGMIAVVGFVVEFLYFSRRPSVSESQTQKTPPKK